MARIILALSLVYNAVKVIETTWAGGPCYLSLWRMSTPFQNAAALVEVPLSGGRFHRQFW